MVRDYTCGSPLNPAPAGVSRLPAGKHTTTLTYYQTIVNKKMKKIILDLVGFGFIIRQHKDDHLMMDRWGGLEHKSEAQTHTSAAFHIRDCSVLRSM